MNRLAVRLLCSLTLSCAVAGFDASAEPESAATPPAPNPQALQLPAIFGEGMILQRDARVPVWGTAQPGALVEVRFAGRTARATAAADGHWRALLEPLPASTEARTLVVTSASEGATRRFDDVLVGDVYLASGQSNLAIELRQSEGGSAEIPNARHPKLRFFEVPTAFAPAGPVADIASRWLGTTPATAGGFSAVAYWFGRKLHAETGVPIGIIEAALGSSVAEAWTPRDALERTPNGRSYLRAWQEADADFDPAAAEALDAQRFARHRAKLDKAKKDGRKLKASQRRPPLRTFPPTAYRGWPATLYNGMIAPLEPFALRGVLWYQGEHNATFHGHPYRIALTSLIESWRAGFEQPELLFVIVQLAGQGRAVEAPGDSPIAEARESQRLVHRSLPHTGLVVTIDTHTDGRLHPLDKRTPGERAALWPLAARSGSEVEASGPSFETARVEGDQLVLTFGHLGGGLVVGRMSANPAGPTLTLDGFVIAGPDRKFVAARALIRGDEVVVASAEVADPVAVRYAWADNPVGANLYNRAGLPASPFRTDDWPVSTEGRLEPVLPGGLRLLKKQRASDSTADPAGAGSN